jgi:hypothetical protein
MRLLATISILVFGVNSFAFSFECSKKVSAIRTEFLVLKSYPRLLSYTSFQEITDNTASAGPIDQIAGFDYVCARQVDIDKNCEIVNTPTAVYVDCINDVKMEFEMDQQDQGTLRCFYKGKVTKTWHVGTCKDLEGPIN